tara:strand:- start:169 stop:645 length:477 start_codon:yes stop_codon:yes gene_type:complete
MWTVAKVKNKNISIFEKEFKNKLTGLRIYYPKIKDNSKKIKNLLNNYVFCYHKSFEKNFNFSSIKNLKGLDYFLNGYLKDQEEIKKFINYCFLNQDKNGFVTNSFFKKDIKDSGKFIVGPLVNYFFEVAHKEKNKIFVNVGKFNVSISDTSMSLYQPV